MYRPKLKKLSGNEIYYVIQDSDAVLQPAAYPSNDEPSEENVAIEFVVNESTANQEIVCSESLTNGNSNFTENIKVESIHPRKRKQAQVSDAAASQPSTSSAPSAPGPSIATATVIEDEESDDGEGDSSQAVEGSQPKPKRKPPSIIWPDAAVEKLLSLLEAAYPHMTLMSPAKRAELWNCVEKDMKPFSYSRIECHIKF